MVILIAEFIAKITNVFFFNLKISQINGPVQFNGAPFHSITIIVDNVPELRNLLTEFQRSFRLAKGRRHMDQNDTHEGVTF